MEIIKFLLKLSKNYTFHCLLLFIFFITFYWQILKLPKIEYWDEHVWISQGFYLELLIERDFNNKLWNSLYSYDEPKLVPYIFGSLFYPNYLSERKNKDNNYDYVKFLIDRNFYWDFNFFLKEGKEYKSYLQEMVKMDFPCRLRRLLPAAVHVV